MFRELTPDTDVYEESDLWYDIYRRQLTPDTWFNEESEGTPFGDLFWKTFEWGRELHFITSFGPYGNSIAVAYYLRDPDTQISEAGYKKRIKVNCASFVLLFDIEIYSSGEKWYDLPGISSSDADSENLSKKVLVRTLEKMNKNKLAANLRSHWGIDD